MTLLSVPNRLTRSLLFLAVLTSIQLIRPVKSAGQPTQNDSTSFLGRWALHLDSGAGWLEVRQEAGYLDADLLWRGGSVVPVSHVYVQGKKLVVERIHRISHKSDDENKPAREHMKVQRILLEQRDGGKLGGGKLGGVSQTPRNNGLGIHRETFVATRIPDLPARPDLSKVTYGQKVELFNGKDLTGWEVMNPHAGNGWVVKDGVLMNDPDALGRRHTSNLRTSAVFEDFRLTLDLMVPEGSNSGIYLRGIYEVQVHDSHGQEPSKHNMGAIYSRIAPSVSAVKPAGQWQSYDIILCDRHVTVKLNGQLIIDNQPLYGVTGGALWADESKPGPIYLQGDHGAVSYRNMILHPIVR